MIGKSRRLEVRQLQIISDESQDSNAESPSTSSSSPFPIVLSVPINGRITSLTPFHVPTKQTALLFVTTDQYQYAVIGYNSTASSNPSSSSTSSYSQQYNLETYCSGHLREDVVGTLSECGPLVTVDPHDRCIVLHLQDGLVTVFPILGTGSMMLGPAFYARLEERTILSMTMLHHLDPTATPPHTKPEW